MDLEAMFNRQHPFYRQCRECWENSQAAYAGGAEYLPRALIQHVSEVDLEFAERLRRAYYFNYPRKIARLITQYVLACDPLRGNALPELVEDFSRSGLRTNEIMRQFSTLLNVYGCAYMLVEMPCFSGPVDPLRKRNEKLRPYAVALSPLSVPDWSTDASGELNWAVIEERFFDNQDYTKEPQLWLRRRLLTRDEWHLWQRDPAGGNVVEIASGRHGLGKVPLIRMEEVDGFGMAAGHWFADVVRISNAILNNESEAQMNVVKQMFGLLVIAESFAQGNAPAEQQEFNPERFSHVLARSAAIWETPNERGISRYIAPNGAETSTILAENQHLKQELFDVVGMTLSSKTGERQSAASKAWDHQLIRQFLCNRVDLLEQAELEAWKLMHAYDESVPVPEVVYNRDFSVLDLQESIAGLLDLREIKAGPEYRREIARAAVALLSRYKKITPERQQKMFDEIERLDPEALQEVNHEQ